MTTIYLIRHGQASWGKKNYDKLSDLGISQSTVLGNHLNSWKLFPSKIISGDLRRHKETAEHCLQAMGIHDKWDIDSNWNEFDFQEVIEQFKPLYKVHGIMVADLARTGSPRKHFKDFFEQALTRWQSGAHDAEYRESWLQFHNRIQRAMQSLLTLESEKDVLIFTSGGVIGTIISKLLKLPHEKWRPLVVSIINTGVTQLHLKNGQLQLISFNAHAHFKGVHQELLSTH